MEHPSPQIEFGKPPPFLLGAALLFWGWQTNLLVAGTAMALLVEGARWIQARWEFSDQDFNRIWTFCTLVLIGSVVFAFTNEGLSDFRGLVQNPSFINQRNAGLASARTVASVLRWLPMIFFLFMAAQIYSTRQGVPLETVSLILRLRWRKARRLGRPLPASRSLDISYPYFGVCLFGGSLHAAEGLSFFWGGAFLIGWALLGARSRRFSVALWAAVFALAVLGAFFAQRGIAQLQHYVENYNPQWLADFARHRFDPTQSRTDLGSVARRKLSGAIVIRLEARSGVVPERLREATYCTFRGLSWYAEATEKDFENVPSETNGTSWVLVPGKVNSGEVHIGCYLDGGRALLPLPGGSGRLEKLPAYLVQKSALGAVLAQGPGLVLFNALYGPGATIDSAADTGEDLSVPQRERPALDETIEGLGLRGQDFETQLRTIHAYFLDKFSYSSSPAIRGRYFSTNDTPLARFLLSTHRGHCEYFASATVLLLRRLDIRARYAVGYAVHEGSGKNYVIRQRDAHAWCLVWDRKAGQWRDFDTTPASWLKADGMGVSSFQAVKDFWSRLWFEFSRFRWGQSNLRQYLLWIFGPILLILLAQIIFRRRRRARGARSQAGALALAWPGLDSELYDLEKLLAQSAGPREPAAPISAWLRRAGEPLAPSGASLDWERLVWLHYRYRFDPKGLTGPERAELKQRALQALADLRVARA
jgi:transglutaminase-like putative cysteine protease